MNFDTAPASDYPLADLVTILNHGFEGYLVPILFNVTTFLNMVRRDGIDLTASRVLITKSQPVGIALIARRGWTSRLAAMGITHKIRGKGAGSWLMKQLIAEACQRGEREMVLEVIEQNEPAIHLYEKCGFQTVRRLVSLVRRDAVENITHELHEMDLREAGRLISLHGLTDLPWQLSGESIAQMNPPMCAYGDGQALLVLSSPYGKDIAIWSLLVEPASRGQGLGAKILRAIIAHHPGRTWHVPAILPEELARVYERAGFVRESLSQLQMTLGL